MAARKPFDAGCMEYVQAEVTVTVSFPKDMAICDICDFCRSENNGTRFRCMLNSRILPYHGRGIGIDCPLPGIHEKLRGGIADNTGVDGE